MTISPLIPHLPAFLSFFIYGLITGGLFRYGRRGGRGCLFPLIFWYGFAILSVFLALLVSVQESTNQASFAVGVLIPFARSMWESEAVQAPLHFVRVSIDTIQHTAWQIGRLWQAWQDRKERTQAGTQTAGQQGNRGNGQENQQHHGHQSQGNNQNNQHTQDQARDRERHQEQQQREAEAHARREQAEQERQERQNANKPRPDTDDAPRDPEAVLGLKTGYTDEDLRTAYKREAGRTHPDKWIGKPEAIRQMMEAEYKAIQEAYKILQNRRP